VASREARSARRAEVPPCELRSNQDASHRDVPRSSSITDQLLPGWLDSAQPHNNAKGQKRLRQMHTSSTPHRTAICSISESGITPHRLKITSANRSTDMWKTYLSNRDLGRKCNEDAPRLLPWTNCCIHEAHALIELSSRKTKTAVSGPVGPYIHWHQVCDCRIPHGDFGLPKKTSEGVFGRHFERTTAANRQWRLIAILGSCSTGSPAPA
jgi:hypothetical protein